MKAAVNNDRTHNLSEEAYWVSGLKENRTSGSYGEGLETGRASVQVPRQSFTRQSYFRDTKDARFGLGLDAIHTRSPARRDRLFLLSALAIVLMTLLGGACEAVGYDRYLKANTVKRRTHSLFRQGLMIYELMPTMDETWLTRIMESFAEALRQHRVTNTVFGVVCMSVQLRATSPSDR